MKVTPTNIRIIIEEVNHPFCEASPDFCDWEHEYLMFHALNDLAPYTHTNVHAKYWDHWKNPDVRRNVRIMLDNGYKGIFALEYEDGPWDGVEGSKYLIARLWQHYRSLRSESRKAARYVSSPRIRELIAV